jgi:hypothetical protein
MLVVNDWWCLLTQQGLLLLLLVDPALCPPHHDLTPLQMPLVVEVEM